MACIKISVITSGKTLGKSGNLKMVREYACSTFLVLYLQNPRPVTGMGTGFLRGGSNPLFPKKRQQAPS